MIKILKDLVKNQAPCMEQQGISAEMTTKTRSKANTRNKQKCDSKDGATSQS